ncbi:MarR family protein [Paenibacillus sp. UNCCL117]|uniref:MarR family winged helix-turn-helix transcriptional regulator n=1 Tax=unclassified Paenibacillus TaxID=185978 RepID=UPI00088EBC1D|nr:MULTISPECIES: MarR family winged helix-turn-helix transcriptional regulator [unclassified Paenibacillus]SDE49454.1 MarR family protein [Paenibacillus sp. cl123]SFW66896.1 MarR family protein [Paenibacillus sp. UNCCL117]
MAKEGAGYELTMLFAAVFRLAVDELHTELAKLGFDNVRPSHGFIFQKLSWGGATGNEIAEHLGITKQAASVIIDQLEANGYVARAPHPTDRRGKLVVLTDRGWQCIRATETIFTSIEARWHEALPGEEMEKLRLSMRTLAGTFPESKLSPFRPVW